MSWTCEDARQVKMGQIDDTRFTTMQLAHERLARILVALGNVNDVLVAMGDADDWNGALIVRQQILDQLCASRPDNLFSESRQLADMLCQQGQSMPAAKLLGWVERSHQQMLQLATRDQEVIGKAEQHLDQLRSHMSMVQQRQKVRRSYQASHAVEPRFMDDKQ